MRGTLILLVLCICFSVFYITDAKEIEIIDVTFENSSGRELSALLCLPDDEGKHPAIVGCGGWAGSLHQYNNWPKFLAENGYIVLWIEPTFETSALLSMFGLSVWPQDIRDAVDWLLDTSPAREIVDKERIGLMGHSLGSIAVTKEAESDSRIKAVVALSTPNPSAMRDLEAPLMVISGDLDLSLYEIVGFLRNFLMPCMIFEPLCLLSLPLLLPISALLNMASLIALPAYYYAEPPKEIIVISGGTHNGMSKIGDAVWPKPYWEIDMCEHYSLAWFDYFLKMDRRAYSYLVEPYGELSLFYPSLYDLGKGEEVIGGRTTSSLQSSLSSVTSLFFNYLIPCRLYLGFVRSFFNVLSDADFISSEISQCLSFYRVYQKYGGI